MLLPGRVWPKIQVSHPVHSISPVYMNVIWMLYFEAVNFCTLILIYLDHNRYFYEIPWPTGNYRIAKYRVNHFKTIHSKDKPIFWSSTNIYGSII